MPTSTNLQQFLASPESYDGLRLNGQHITDNDCINMGSALKGHETFTYLHLSHNQIGDTGASAIAKGIKNMSLTIVHLHNNHIGDDGAIILAEAIKGMTSLNWLSLDYNQIGDIGAIAICQAIKDMQNLNILYLNENRIGADTKVPLEQELHQVKDLRLDNQNGANSKIAQLELQLQQMKQILKEKDEKLDNLHNKMKKMKPFPTRILFALLIYLVCVLVIYISVP